MELQIVYYGHPALRRRGKPIERFDAELEQLVERLLAKMYEADGVGLAAQQVALDLQLFVIDIREATERTSTVWVEGKEADPAQFMPLVGINAQIEPFGDIEWGVEGCLSFPGIFAEIPRPQRVRYSGYNQRGELIQFEAAGLLSRAIQHEFDHTRGILFIDRMDPETREELRPELQKIWQQTQKILTTSS